MSTKGRGERRREETEKSTAKEERMRGTTVRHVISEEACASSVQLV